MGWQMQHAGMGYIMATDTRDAMHPRFLCSAVAVGWCTTSSSLLKQVCLRQLGTLSSQPNTCTHCTNCTLIQVGWCIIGKFVVSTTIHDPSPAPTPPITSLPNHPEML